MQRCSNCNQPLTGNRDGEPCGRCGYLEGIELMEEVPEDELAGPSSFRRLVWWMAMIVVAGTLSGVLWLMLRFQDSLVKMTNSY